MKQNKVKYQKMWNYAIANNLKDEIVLKLHRFSKITPRIALKLALS